MCNLYTTKKSIDEVSAWFRRLEMPLRFPEGILNLAPKDIAITDAAPIVRAGDGGYDLIARRWSWPGPSGKPVYNFRSDEREFATGRCLIVADGFYEFTAPVDPKRKRKDRWLFTDPSGGLLGIAGLVREAPEIGEAFTMLTTEPGVDVAPYVEMLNVTLRRRMGPYSESRPVVRNPASTGRLITRAPEQMLSSSGLKRR